MKPLRHKIGAWIAILATATLTACGGGDEYEGFDASVSSSTPNKYLTFFNRQGDLAAGNYTLVAATAVAAEIDTFSLSISYSNGGTEAINGNWTGSGGLDPDPTCGSGNRCYPISLRDAGGITATLSSAVDTALYLVDDSDTPRTVASANASGAGLPETLSFSESEIDETGFATAYYAAIDPMNARDTAQKYRALHGLDNPDEHVIFRDSKDLGYGRDMYMVSYDNFAAGSSCGPPGAVTIAFFVRNFSVQIVDGFAYGPVNLEAAIAEDLQHHVGSNAIEFGYGRDDVGDTCSPEPMTKYYTFEPVYDSPDAPHPRRLRVDLDARGQKAMPQPCISCHGGKLRPLDRFGRFVAMHANDAQAQIGDTKARLQAFEVDSFEYSDEVGHRRADYEDVLRRLNAAIYCTYPGSQGHAACTNFGNGVAPQADIGEWSGDFGREMLLGWYGNSLETANTVYDGSYVPPGWTPSVGGPPVGADSLFTKVVGPNCFVCHGKRGNELGSDTNLGGDGKDLDFRSWDKFISHADEIERLVFSDGRMPLGLLNFQNFWGDPEKAELLASFIAPYVTDSAQFRQRISDAEGNIRQPGQAIVARAGPDRVTRSNAAIALSAQASLFADGYSWRVVSAPAGSTPSLSASNAMRTDFSADLEGEYIAQLTSSSSETGASVSDTVTIQVDDTLATAPRDLDFYGDIAARLNTCAGTCHSNGAQAGIPVWWVADASQPSGVPATVADPPSLGFYEQVMARVNHEDIEDSLLLKKPSGVHHYGAQRVGFDTTLDAGAAGRADYDMFLNWIAEGAPCGGTPNQCVR